MTRPTCRLALLAALLCLACAPDPEPYPALIRLDSDLVAQEPEVTEALQRWRTAFPGCPHVIASVADITFGDTQPGDMVLRPEQTPNIGGRYDYARRTIEIDLESIARGGVIGTVLHELGHGHGVTMHTEGGLMAAERDPSYATIDEEMVDAVCLGDHYCCEEPGGA